MNNLNFLLDEIGINKKTLAKACGLSGSLISAYASGKRKMTIRSLKLFSNFFVCDQKFVNGEDDGHLVVGILSSVDYNSKVPQFNFVSVKMTKNEYLEFKANNFLFVSITNVSTEEDKVVRFGFFKEKLTPEIIKNIVSSFFCQGLLLINYMPKDFFAKNDISSPILNFETISKLVMYLFEKFKILPLQNLNINNGTPYSYDLKTFNLAETKE